jgi:alpha-2-macroglobulin
MFTDKTNQNSGPRNLFLSWEIMLLYCLLAAVVVLLLQQPTGGVSGQIALEEGKFGLKTYGIRQNKVYAVATGPREGTTIARGVWVNQDGTFKIEQLPIGEYQIKVRAPGFETENVENVFITQGKVAPLKETISMHVLEPSVSIASNVRVFTTKENPSFWITATGAVESTIKIYKKSFLETATSKPFVDKEVHISTDLSLYPSYSSKFVSPFPATETPFKVVKRALSPNFEDSARADFKLDNDLPPGDYFVVAECADLTKTKNTQAIWWFTVSDIGLIAKHSPEGTLVRAIDLNTMQGVSGVNLQMIPKDAAPKDVFAKGVTGADGITFIKTAPGANYDATLLADKQGHHAYASGGYWYGGEGDDYTTYFYTDRPIYRLGQTVCFKGIARELEKSGFQNIGGEEEIAVVIEDPSNVQLYSGKIKTSKFGTFHGQFEIPAEGKTGAYSCKLTYASSGKTAYEYFEVDQYRKPEYKIDIKPSTARITAGSKATAILSATYFFGGPVANAKVKYNIYASPDWSARYRLQPRPDYYSYFDDWSNGEEDSYDYGGSFVGEGVAQTDENGQATITFDTKKIEPNMSNYNYYYEYGDKRYKIEAEVTDISQLTVTGSGSVAVTAGDYALFVNSDNYVVKSGEGVQANIEARDYDGKPVANQKVHVKVSRWPYDATVSGRNREVVVTEGDVTTDAEGKVKFSSTAGKQWPTDSFYITASAKDSHGDTIVDSTSIWVASDDYPYVSSSTSNKEAFKISLNKKVFQTGETARVMISGPFTGKEGYDALVTIEGTTIYSHRIVPLKAAANLVEIPITKEYAPNVFVSVAMVAKKKQFYTTSEMVMVSPKDHFLNLAISSDKQKYKAGETANYTIKATYEDGRPAPNTELSLGVVDESIYSIRAENAPDIRKTFYSQRQNKVNTFCSFPETYSGGPDKTANDPKLRKNFKDTAIWIPQLVTDANGVATAKVPLPDNLTTWRATVRGVTMGCDVGASTQSIMVTQDIIARLALPRFYTEGDGGEISAIVHNYSDVPQNIHLTLTVSDQFKSSVALAQNLSIEKDKVAKFTWPVSIAKPGVGTIRLKAVGQTGGDYLERKLPVNALGIPLFNVDSGVLTDAIPSVQISHTDVGSVFSPKMTVNLAGSVIGQVQGTFDGLIDYPYGCTEQTMSRFMPSIIAMQLNKKLHVPLLPESLKRFEKVKVMGMAKLSEHQHSDGGWGWWKDDTSDPYMTSLVLEGLNLLKDTGYTVDKTMPERGLKWLTDNTTALEKQLSDPKLVNDYNAETRRCDMARLVYTLSVYKTNPTKSVLAWLKAEIPKFTPEPLAYTAMALKNLGDEAGAQQAATRLLALANKTETTVDWEHTEAMMKRLKLVGATDYSYRYTGEETTALALRAMLAVYPDKEELLEQIKHWMMLHRDQNGWCNTKTTSEVLLALLKDALLSASTSGDTVSAKILMDNILSTELTFNGGDLFAKEKSFSLASFLPTKNSVQIQKVGQGKLYYNTLLRYTKALKPGEPLPVKNSPAGLTMTRSFMRLETAPAGPDGVLKVVTKPFNGGTIKAGETILMKVLVDCPMSLPYVIVECPLPSGAEVVQSNGASNAVDTSENSTESISGDWGRYWWSHQDVLDDKIVFFGTTIPAGKKEFHTLLRMELPGKVNCNPVTLEGMYTKLIRGYTTSEQLNIK